VIDLACPRCGRDLEKGRVFVRLTETGAVWQEGVLMCAEEGCPMFGVPQR